MTGNMVIYCTSHHSRLGLRRLYNGTIFVPSSSTYKSLDARAYIVVRTHALCTDSTYRNSEDGGGLSTCGSHHTILLAILTKHRTKMGSTIAEPPNLAVCGTAQPDPIIELLSFQVSTKPEPKHLENCGVTHRRKATRMESTVRNILVLGWPWSKHWMTSITAEGCVPQWTQPWTKRGDVPRRMKPPPTVRKRPGPIRNSLYSYYRPS